MKMLSFNIRGLGTNVKRREVRELINKKKINICCIQETKMQKMENRLCRVIWGNNAFDWACKESVGR